MRGELGDGGEDYWVFMQQLKRLSSGVPRTLRCMPGL